MRRKSKHFIGIDLSGAAAREITDTLVIFSMVFLMYIAISDWGGLSILQRIVGMPFEPPSFLYFAGVALVIFSVRRIADQRREQRKRRAAEHYGSR